jgi:hypothetical protein
MDKNASLNVIGQLRKSIQDRHAEIVAQNEIIARLELSGQDAREARAIRAQLWLSQETDRAEIERLEDINKQEAQRQRGSAE